MQQVAEKNPKGTFYTQESFPQFLHNKPAYHNCHTIYRWCW